MTMYDEDKKTKTLTRYCLNCEKFLGIHRQEGALVDLGQDFCTLFCESEYDKKQKGR